MQKKAEAEKMQHTWPSRSATGMPCLPLSGMPLMSSLPILPIGQDLSVADFC